MILGLTAEDLKKPTITQVNEVEVHDEKGGNTKVHIGDQVELSDPEKNETTLDYLGPGPYTIEWLGQWRCGRDFLQLTTPTKGKGKGVNASKFKITS